MWHRRSVGSKLRGEAPEGDLYPGSPKGHAGKTRLRLKPDVVKTPEVNDRCERCGTPLGEPSFVDHHIVEDIPNPQSRQVIDFLEFTWECDMRLPRKGYASRLSA